MKVIFFVLLSIVPSVFLCQSSPDIEKIDDAVVLIKIYDSKNNYIGHGSGFSIDSVGNIVTNFHVVEIANSLKVTFDRNGLKKEYIVSKILRGSKEKDLAILELQHNQTDKFPFIKISKSLPKKGEECWAIGTPDDPDYMNSVSKGLISNTHVNGISNWKAIILQTNAAITHGSSGGVLLNNIGEAVGITCGGKENIIKDVNDIKQNLDATRAQINFAISSLEIESLPIINKMKILDDISLSSDICFYTDSRFPQDNIVYINGICIGTISKTILCDKTPNCGDDNTLTKTMYPGTYSYLVYNKRTKLFTKGYVILNQGQCTKIKIDKSQDEIEGQLIKTKLKFKIDGHEDDVVYLIKYFGKGLYYADTACLKNGFVEFDGSKQTPGILGVLLPEQKYFEFIYNNEEVYLETKFPDFIESMIVKKSEENKVFIDYIKFIGPKKTESGKLTEQRSKLKPEDPKFKELTDKIDAINKEVIDYQNNLIKTNPGKLVSKIVKMSMDIDIPEAPKDDKGNIMDSNFRFNYFRTHFWDNVDLSDDRLVNTPIFHSKLEYYFGKNMMIQHWDTILYHANKFCDALNPKSKTFEYCVSWITSSYGKSNIMGMDKVYVMMADKYYCSKNTEGKSPAFWMKEDKLEELCEKIPVQKNLVLGVRPPNVILRDTTDSKWQDFYSLGSEYTILYFWDPECGHCKKTTPKLETLYKEKFKARNVEIFAVGKAVGEDFGKWKKFIKENNLTFINVAVTEPLFKAAMEDARQFVPRYTTLESLNYQTTYDIFSTPRVFVLDKDKNIIAKSLSISQLEEMLDRLQGKQDFPKIFPPDPEEDEQMK